VAASGGHHASSHGSPGRANTKRDRDPVARGAFAELRRKKEPKIVPGPTHLFEEPGALEAAANLAWRPIGFTGISRLIRKRSAERLPKTMHRSAFVEALANERL
jgi:hypothetical protein